MPDSGSANEKIQIGHRVLYRLSNGDRASDINGKVLGLFNTQDGQTLADVEWETLGPPRRLNVANLTKV